MIDTIAFDADDTLWDNEPLFQDTQSALKDLLQDYLGPAELDGKLLETERRNLRLFGYGVKGFTLSMIESAIELTEGRITGDHIQHIIDLGKAIIDAPIDLLPYVEETVHELHQRFPLFIITKGDLFHQEIIIARSGLAHFFAGIEIVSEKNDETYREILARRGLDARRFLMVGNSLQSDILPVLHIGGRAVHVPYRMTWALDRADPATVEAAQFDTIADLSQLESYIDALSASARV